MVSLAPRRFASLAAAICFLTFALIASTPTEAQADAAGVDQSFMETIEVELVNVDIWVTDRNGEPVRGLPASAFDVTHNGDTVELDYFAELGPGAADGNAADEEGVAGQGETTEAPATQPTRRDSNYLVIYLDQLRLENRDYATTLGALRTLIEDPALVPEHVLIVRQDRGLFVEANLGTQRAGLLNALDRMATSNVAGLQTSAELDQALDALQTEWKQSKEQAAARGGAISSIPGLPTGQTDSGARGAIGGAGSSFGPDACDLFTQRAGATVNGWARSQAQRTAISLDFLSRTATFLAGLPGVKTVLYVSGGLETRPGAALADFVRGLCPGGESLLSLDELGEQMNTQFFGLTRHFNSNRVTIYPFKVGQLRSSAAGSAAAGSTTGAIDSFRAQNTFEQRQRSEAIGGLGLLADETGGRLLTREDQITALGERLASRYSLAYPLPDNNSGTEMRIKVKLASSAPEGLEISHRRSFLDKTPGQRLAELVDGALFLGLVENSLGLRLGAGDLQQKTETWLLPLRVQVPAARLTFDPTVAEPKASLAVRVVARHLATGKLTTAERTFRIKQPPGQVDESARAQLPIDLELDAGPVSIAVGVRDQIAGLSSVVSTALEVGPPPGPAGP